MVFRNSWFYNWPFDQDVTATTFQSESVQSSLASVDLGYLNYKFVQSPVMATETYTREGFVGVVALIGGFIGMIKTLSLLMLGSYQNFTIDKSMIKKIFSKRESKDKHPTHNLLRTPDGKQDQLRSTIRRLSIFRNEYVSYRWQSLKRCFCCCRRPKPSKQMRQYNIATKKLYHEIDLLEVVKTLRIARFLTSLHMTTDQRELVKFMQAYCINPRKSSVHQSSPASL